MELSPNHEIFLAVLRAALRNERANPAVWAEDIQWEQLMHTAAAHKLLPMIVSAIPPECLPNARMMKQTVIRQVVEQTKKTREFLTLYNAMRAAGFHPLVLKGIVCRGLYPQGDLRPSSDEDLYVPDAEFAGCCEFLRNYGMQPTGEDSVDAYEIGWQKPGSLLYIELHRRLFSTDSAAYGDLESFFSASADSAAAYPTEFRAEVSSMCPHDHMLYLLLHAYKHFVHSGFGIRQICDIGLWARKYHGQIDWDLLAQQCGICCARQYAAAVLGIAEHYLAIPMDLPQSWRTEKEFCEPLLADVLTGGVYGAADSDRLHSATVTLNAVRADRTGGRNSIWNSLFLDRGEMEKKYPYLNKYPFLLPFAWIQRIWQYLTRKGNAGSSIATSVTIGNERVRLLRTYGIIE